MINTHRILATLRAGALSTVGASIVEAAEATQLDVGVLSLGFALRGVPGALDHGVEHAQRMSIGYLLSPGAPTRAIAELMHGVDLGCGGPELSLLAAFVLDRLAQSHSVAALVASISAGGAEPAQRYLGVMCTLLEAAGLASICDGELRVDTARVADALQWIADGSPRPAAREVDAASMRRDGDAICVRATNDVPLEQLVPLALLVYPSVVDNAVELRLGPAELAAYGRGAITHAVDAALA